MDKHTQGQWRYDAKHNAICEGEASHHYCNTLIAQINPNMSEESEANAKLIAAAPKMYEALEMLIDINSTILAIQALERMERFDISEKLKNTLLFSTAALKAATE